VDIQSRGPSERFVNELRRVLQHLYDPAELRNSPLLGVLARTSHTPLSSMRRVLLDAIQALRPGSGVPPHANAWRIYHVLTWRYVEASSQNEVAANLAISPRQLRRLEWDATRVLADYLWARYELAGGEAERWAVSAKVGMAENISEVETPGREQELEWLRTSFPSETVNAADLVCDVVRTLGPLAKASETQVACEVPEGPAPVTGQLATMRQAVLNLAAAAVHSAPGGRVTVTVESGEEGTLVHILAMSDQPPDDVRRAQVDEHLSMARQLVRLFEGNLEGPEGPCVPFVVTLTLPATRQALIVVIDDNADTLRLMQRYLTGTRYRFAGTRDPQEALALAERLEPQAIVLDIMLPGVDGWELFGRLREHPQVGQVPVLVCTILPHESLAQILGAAGFLRKPVSRQALLAALDRHVVQPPSAAQDRVGNSKSR
jgi:CheY-like chemotaxis protein